MKKIISVLIIIACISCSENTEVLNIKEAPSQDFELTEEQDAQDGVPEGVEIEVELPQTWKLFKMTCNTSEICDTEGEEMPYQDTYTFNEDKTVLKVRIKDNDTMRIQGNFKVLETEFESYAFSIKYEGEAQPEDIDLISGCTGRSEYLYITEDEEILINNVSACDGPDLYYKMD